MSPTRRQAQGGFTLIEVLIALAILFGALVMMLATVTGDIKATGEAKLMSAATGLARAKMLDIEEELLFKGFQETAETMEGDFSDDGFARYRWKATIEKVELPPIQQLQTAEGAAAAGAAPGTGLPGAPGATSLTNPANASDAMGASLLSGQFELISGVLENAIRKVTLTVTWEMGREVKDLVVVCYFTDPKSVDAATSNLPDPSQIPGGIGGGIGGGGGGGGGGGAGGGGGGIGGGIRGGGK